MTLDEGEILGDNIESKTTFVVHNVKTEFPFIHSASLEHIGMCLPCAQKAMRHHAGVGNPLDEDGLKVGVAYISQISERANIILEQANRILIENEKQIKELHETVTEISALVKENSDTVSEVLTELKDTIKKDLTRFYKIVTIVSVPMIVITSFVISWISAGIA